MPRKARRKSATKTYHIILRGVNKQEIFHDDADRIRFLSNLEINQRKFNFSVYGWCLMGNHVHLLMREGDESISDTMRRIAGSYAIYYNNKYDTVGHLFQDRFKSEGVETRGYLLSVIRYIHQNPVKAYLVTKPDEWKWSSCAGYYGYDSISRKLLQDRLILKLFSENSNEARDMFKEFNEARNDDACMDAHLPNRRVSDDQARATIKEIIYPLEIPQVKSLPRNQLLQNLQKIKQSNGISQRQASRILGISKNLMFKA